MKMLCMFAASPRKAVKARIFQENPGIGAVFQLDKDTLAP
jgi:hypothetical protein